jgi:carbonic anhydrase
MLENIKPALDHFTEYTGDRTSQNDEYVHMVSEQNVRITIENIRQNSPILKEMEQKAEIKIVGAMYDMDTAVVSFYEH